VNLMQDDFMMKKTPNELRIDAAGGAKAKEGD
jgi:hypothetical protein